jgi:effector-binding domain-containing protein
MNNKIKYLLYAIVAVFVLIFTTVTISGLILPKTQVIKVSKVIDAPASIIYKNISDYNQWKNWDPWASLDPKQVRTMSGEAGTIGHGYSWIGNDQVGKGTMAITSLEKDKNLKMDLSFKEPFESKAKVEYTIEEKNGKSEVAWIMYNENPIYLKLVMKLMEGSLKKDFDKGLSGLKTISEKQAAEFAATYPAGPTFEIKETELSAKNYVLFKSMNQPLNTLTDFFMKEMPKTATYASNNKMEVDGYPSAFYYKYDGEKGTTDLAIAIPVKKHINVSSPYEAYILNPIKAISIDYYGDYDKMEPAYNNMYAYIASKNLKQAGPSIEEYRGDPMTVNGDMSKCLTRISIPVK